MSNEWLGNSNHAIEVRLQDLSGQIAWLADKVAIHAGILEAWQVERQEAEQARRNAWHRRLARWLKESV